MRNLVIVSPVKNIKKLSQCLKPANTLKKSPASLMRTARKGNVLAQMTSTTVKRGYTNYYQESLLTNTRPMSATQSWAPPRPTGTTCFARCVRQSTPSVMWLRVRTLGRLLSIYLYPSGNSSRVESSDSGELAAALDNFDNCVILNPVSYNDKIVR